MDLQFCRRRRSVETLQRLRERAAQTALFDERGLDDPYQRQLLAALLRRVLAEIDP